MTSAKTKTHVRTKICFVLTLMLLVIVPAFGRYTIDWYTIDGGGGTSAGGPYVLTGTIGQPDAAYSSGGDYEMLAGFWPGGPLCFVEFDDFARFAQHWLDGGLDADLNKDLALDFLDVQMLSDYWLTYCPYGWRLK
ncbi:MAG: hypothetical protein JSU94_21105 [Phycisphaerales bacterium]|nr:MAG: hypothetical protein JSU94_21105 [Phycisphaerales bacterium]